MNRGVLVGMLLVSACGSEPGPQLRASLRLAEGLAPDVSSYTIHILAPLRKDDRFLSCSQLTSGFLPATDERIVAFARLRLGVEESSATFPELPAGEGRIIFVTVQNLSGSLIGNGCVEGVTVVPEQTTRVTVVVFRL